MKVTFASKEPVTDAACKKATGRTLSEWYKKLDAASALDLGRRETVSYLWEDVNKNAWWSVTIAVEYEKFKDIKKKDGRFEGYGICPTKTIAASPADIYKALTDAAMLQKWCGVKPAGPVDTGTRYSSPDGESGEYLRVRKDKDLRFTWTHADATAPTQVDISMDVKGAKTTVMVNHSRLQSRAEADGLHAAWTDALDRLKALLEK